MTKPCCNCLLIECLLWRPRRAMWFPENDFTLLVTMWTECFLNLHWRIAESWLLSSTPCTAAPCAVRVPPLPRSEVWFDWFTTSKLRGLVWLIPRAVFTSSLFLFLIISFLEMMSRCKMKLSAQRSLVSLSIYSDTLVLLQCSFGSQPNIFGCYTPCFLQKC